MICFPSIEPIQLGKFHFVLNLCPICFQSSSRGGAHVNWLRDLIDAVTYFIDNLRDGGCSSLKSCMQSPKGIASC